MANLKDYISNLRNDKEKLIEVLRQRDEGIEDNTTFTQLVSVVEANIGKYKPRVTSFREYNGTELDYELNNIDMSLLTSTSFLFYRCQKLENIPVKQLDTRNVTSMNSMFSSCAVLQSIPQMDTSKVTSMSSMFDGCKKIQSIPQFDTSNVTSVSNMLYSCSALQSIPLLDFGKVVQINYFAVYNYALTSIGGFKDLGKAYLTTRAANYYEYKLDLHDCVSLTHDSLMNVINNLYDIASIGVQPQQLVLGTTNLAKLTEEEIAIATNKGWNVTT